MTACTKSLDLENKSQIRNIVMLRRERKESQLKNKAIGKFKPTMFCTKKSETLRGKNIYANFPLKMSKL